MSTDSEERALIIEFVSWLHFVLSRRIDKIRTVYLWSALRHSDPARHLVEDFAVVQYNVLIIIPPVLLFRAVVTPA